jgi:hypothetical protein
MNRGPSLRPCGRPGPKPEDLGWMTAMSSCSSPAHGVVNARRKPTEAAGGATFPGRPAGLPELTARPRPLHAHRRLPG